MAGKNTILKQVREGQIFPDIQSLVTTTTSFDQGDFQILIAAEGHVRAPTAEAEGAYLLGVAALSVSNGKPLSPYSTANDAALAVPSLNGPLYGDIVSCVLKTGESLAPGAYVYADPATSGRGVAASGTKAIGVYQGPNTITSSAAGLEIAVLIGARFPNDSLKF